MAWSDGILTQQDIFDKVWDWFVVKGNQKSMNGDMCAYRSSGGRRCAVGVMLEDSDVKGWTTLILGSSVISIADCGLLPLRLRPHVEFLAGLQAVHDRRQPGASFTVAMEGALHNFAVEYGLKVPT